MSWRILGCVVLSLLFHGPLLLNTQSPQTRPTSFVPVEIIPVRLKPESANGRRRAGTGAPIGTPRYTVDTLKELAEAESELSNPNLLQRREFVFHSYIERIRAAVETGWIAAIRLRHSRRKLPKEIVATVVWMIIDQHGLVIDALVVRTCGDSEIDAIATSSILGKTFPNPPKSLLDKDGFGRLLWTYRIR